MSFVEGLLMGAGFMCAFILAAVILGVILCVRATLTLWHEERKNKDD